MAQLAALIDPQGRPKPAGLGRLSVRCPSHKDENPSLTVWIDDKGKAAFNCHAGCSHQRVVDGLSPRAREAVEATWGKTATAEVIVLRPSHTPAPPVTPEYHMIEGEYPYIGEDGETLHYLVRRYDGKNYKQFHKISDKLVAGRGPAPLIPYRLPDVLAAIRASDPIYIVEGEKDADTLATHGVTATCNVGGAGKWTEDLNKWFTGAVVYIFPDNDTAGQDHARKVKEHLPDATIISLPGLPEKGDVTDWLKTHTIEELHELTARPPTVEEFQFSTGDYIFKVPLVVESIWGRGQESLWAVGEPLMIYGPTGIGKTTLAGKLLLSLIGVDSSELLGYPVEPIPDGTTVLYVAADRPRQAMRSLRRMAPQSSASLLAQRLRIEHQRQIWASDKDPEMLHRAAIQAKAAIVFIDSSKDLAGGPLKDEGPAKALMDAVQICIANEVDVAMLHHPRKAAQESGTKRELDLDDVYGSAWLTAGSGSVLLVDGKPGSGEFRFEQLKAPATFVNQMEVAIDYETGELVKRTIRDLDVWIKEYGMPITVRMATAYKLAIAEEVVDTDSSEYKKVKRHIESLERDGLVVQADPRGNAKRYQWYEHTL